MVASWRPDIAVQVAFNADPNDPAAVPNWTDLTTLFRAASRLTSGRQYELDQNQGAQPQLVFLDQNQYLNPANSASPYAPKVLPYRRILWQAMWPNDPAGNLLNTAYGLNPSLRTTVGYDPTFESYSAGASVPWIAAVGGTTPVVGTTTPRTGTRDLSWSVVNGSTPQGASLVVPCIPGRQYTDSLYVSQSSASTQQIGITGQNLALDSFNRVVSSGWGAADVGGAWTVSGGVAADYSVSGGTAFQSLGSTSVVRASFIGSGIVDATVTAKATVPVIAAGGAIQARVVLRRVDANNFYMLEAKFNTDQTVLVNMWKAVGGTATQIGSAFAPFTYAPGTSVWLRFTATGPNLTGVCWQDGSSPAFGVTVSTTDSALTAGAAVGVHSSLNSLNSNTLPVVIAWSSFTAVGTVYGTTTATTGSYQRLAVTYTATQPTHTLQVATTGTAVAGTVLLDDIQHEQAASASAFTATGPAIFGVLDESVERWPSRWDHMGFLGQAAITCVDGFGPQNLIALWTEYRNSVLAKRPAYYWVLNEGQNATIFVDASGNRQQSLVTYASPAGAFNPVAPGTSMDVPGDPSGTGVGFSSTNPSGFPATGVALAAGAAPKLANTPLLIPPVLVPNVGWAVTVAFWCQVQSNSFTQTAFYASLPLGTGLAYEPIEITLAGGGTNIPTISFTPNGGGGGFWSGSTVTADGKPHLVVGQIQQDAANTTIKLWVDGNPDVNTTVTNVSIGGYLANQGTAISVGGRFNGYNTAEPCNGPLSHVAIWNRALSTTEVADLAAAGKGYPGETSGQRVTRYLSYGWTGPTAVDTGQSIMGVSNLTAGTALLAANQGVATTENGNYWVDNSGSSTFAARTARYLATTSTLTFGEREDLGEYPYLGDIIFDFDPTLVYNQVEVDNANGVVAVRGDAASQRAYFPRGYQRQINVKDNLEALDAAQYLLNQHKDPHLRVQAITLDPVGNSRLWQVVLSLRIGQRVTVKRRVTAANNGAGLTIQADFFVEQISLDQVDMRGIWLYRLYLSPVDVTQAGILNDSTFGRLGTAGARLNLGINAAALTAVVNLTGGDLFTTTGTFRATIDSEIVTVTAVSGVASPQTLTITRPTDGTAAAHGAGAVVQVYQPFVLAY